MGSSTLTVVKIDLCKSKAFAGRNEPSNPLIRTEALKKLLKVCGPAFPGSDKPFPTGSYYKADGDAVYYLIEKPSVALRAAIEFMQSWYQQGVPTYPECRVFIDRGFVDTLEVSGKLELTGRVFENISMFEKGVEEGRIYLTEGVVDKCDHTMAKFGFHGICHLSPNGELKIYYVDYLDPRTVADSSLIHALFVANPKASEARSRLYELFLIEFLLEKTLLSDFNDFITWARGKNYPVPPMKDIQEILNTSSLIFVDYNAERSRYSIKPEATKEIANAKRDFSEAQNGCIEEVAKCLAAEISSSALDGVDLRNLIDDYLCAVFSEIRMMANYFRSTYHLFASGPDTFKRFDYIIKRHLGDINYKYFDEWRDSFLSGLKTVSEKGNAYIASVFHNVLATYYLNRGSQASAYQIEGLKRRNIYIDTNVLYSLLVPASNYHEIVSYFATPLKNLGITMKVFPFTLEEYEHSLQIVEKQIGPNGPSEFIVRWNPWLYQEYKLNSAKYLGRISVCRQTFSLLKDHPLSDENQGAVGERLSEFGITIESKYQIYTQDQVRELWIELRNSMTNSKWDLSQYWEFIYQQSQKSDAVIRHDVSCIENVCQKAASAPNHDLGPSVLFLTIDSKLLRLRGQYPFVVSAEQFVEYMLPYLFISDIPVKEAERFPNQLLSAQLGTLLVRKPPELAEEVRAFLSDPSLLNLDRNQLRLKGSTIGYALSSDRFKAIVKSGETLSDPEKTVVAGETAKLLEKLASEERDSYFKSRNFEAELEALRDEVANKDQKIHKLERTVRYWKDQRRQT